MINYKYHIHSPFIIYNSPFIINPYQSSMNYNKIKKFVKVTFFHLVHSAGLEPATPWSEAKCSIQLSYECMRWCAMRDSNPRPFA